MSEAALRKSADEPTTERRTLILDAAERRFSRAGFHRTTMQDVAREAGMSPGNLYRYFPSKDALVAGLCERDRVGLAREFQQLQGTGDFLTGFREIGQRHLADSARDKARLCLEIWAEATRNPVIAALQAEFHASMVEQFVLAFETAKTTGAIHVSVDPHAAASVITKLGDGLFVRRATAEDFDAEREIAEVFAVIGGMLRGKLANPDAPCDSSEVAP